MLQLDSRRFSFIYLKGSFRGHLSSSPQRPQHSSTRRRGDVNPVVHFFRSFVSTHVCWHGFLQVPNFKEWCETNNCNPRKEINSTWDMRMTFSHLPLSSSLAPTDPKSLLPLSQHWAAGKHYLNQCIRSNILEELKLAFLNQTSPWQSKHKASFGPRHATLCLAICRLSPQAKFVVMFNMQPMFSLLQ